MNLLPLYEANPPWVYLHVLTEEENKRLPSYLYAAPGHSPAIRVLRGQKMKTRQALMDELGAALQFFEPFGENWHAVKDCLSDINEWMPGDAYIIVLARPQELLADEKPEEVHWFKITFEEVGEWFSHPISDNGPFNRGSVPFHLVLMCEKGNIQDVRRRFGSMPLLE